MKCCLFQIINHMTLASLWWQKYQPSSQYINTRTLVINQVIVTFQLLSLLSLHDRCTLIMLFLFTMIWQPKVQLWCLSLRLWSQCTFDNKVHKKNSPFWLAERMAILWKQCRKRFLLTTTSDWSILLVRKLAHNNNCT